MECFEGERDRTTRYEYRGFWYHADTNYPGRRYVCASKTVQNKCSVSVLVKNGIVEVRRKHTHPPPKSQKTHLATKQMKILAINELDLSPSDIMNRVFAEHKKAARLIKPHCAYNTISYARGRMLPRIPDTLTELVEIIDEFPENLISSYHGYFRSCDGKIGLVFTTAALLEAAGSRETCEIYIDGTFDARPVKPSSAQLLVVHLRKRDVGVPFMHVLCESRTKCFYKEFWSYVARYVPTLQNNIKYIICDYERALIKASQESFPAVHIRGCWFHYIQAVTRHWRRLKMPKKSEKWRKILGMVWAVPLVPADRIGEAFETIGEAMADLKPPTELATKTELFFRYLTNYWGRIPEIISVAGHTSRTNNFSEGYNRQLPAKLGGDHPTMVKFLKGMVRVNAEAERLWMQLNDEGMVLDQYRRKKKNEKEEKNRESLRSLVNDIITMKDFLTEQFPVSEIYLENTDESGALDEMVNQLEAELVDQEDPPDLQMTADSASRNGVIALRQHPLLLKKSKKGGRYQFEKVATVVGIVKNYKTCYFSKKGISCTENK